MVHGKRFYYELRTMNHELITKKAPGGITLQGLFAACN